MNHSYRTDISYVFNDLCILLELLTHIFVTLNTDISMHLSNIQRVLFDAHVNNVKFKLKFGRSDRFWVFAISMES